jgi:ATP-dependent Zn protease
MSSVGLGYRVRPPSSATPSRILTAYHEAGHAVVSALLEVPVVHAPIVPSSSSSARELTLGYALRDHDHRDRHDLEGALKELVILNTGGQAVQRWRRVFGG